MNEEFISQPIGRIPYKTKNVITAKDGYILMMNKYWLCEDGDPTKALFVWKTAQCNGNRMLSEWSLKNTYKAHDNIQVVFIEFAYVPPMG